MSYENPTFDQRVAQILHEAEPSWWNRLNDAQRHRIKRDPNHAIQAAFEAGIRSALVWPPRPSTTGEAR